MGNVVAFPRFAIRTPEPKPKRARKTRAKSPTQPVGDDLDAGLAACFARMREDDAERSRGLERWARGERPSLAWFGETSVSGIATDHFGEGPDHYRLALAHAGEPVAADDMAGALALAVDTLNSLAYMVRYGGLRSQGCTASRNREEEMRHEECARGVVSDLAATMIRLQAFGTVPRQTPAERRRDAARSQAKHESLDALRKAVRDGDHA